MADEQPIQTPEAQELAPHQADVAEAGQVVVEAPSPLEEARRQLAERQAEVAEAGRVVTEASDALAATRDSVSAITAKIEDADDDAIAGLAAERATAVAKGEALAKRLIAKQRALAEAQELQRQAATAVDEITLAADRQSLAELEAELKELVETCARECDERRVKTLGVVHSANAAGRRLAGARGNAVSFTQYIRQRFETADQIVATFKAAVDRAEAERAMARHRELEQLRAAALQEHFAAKIRGGWTPPGMETNRVPVPAFTPPPEVMDPSKTINDLND